MKILIAPLHYIADNEEGSEYSRAYDYIKYISGIENLEGDVLVGYMKEERLGNFNITRLFPDKPKYISNITRIRFLIWVFFQSMKLLLKNKYDLIWHNGPFAIGETFSLLGLLNPTKTPFVVGPIVSPHSYIGSDEARSMGKKVFTGLGITTRFHRFIDNQTYFISRIFSNLSYLTLKKQP